MTYRIKSWLWNKFFSLENLLAGLSKLMMRLEKLAAMRQEEIEAIDRRVDQLQALAMDKAREKARAERIKSRFEALTQ